MWILFVFAIFCFGLAIAAFVEALNNNEPILFVAVVFCIIFGITIFNLANKEPIECWKCCNQMNESQYCTECGKEKPAEYKNWTCCEREHDKDIKFCPDCGKARPGNNDTINNVVVKDNENVEVNVNSGGVVIIEDDIKNTETNNDVPTTVPDADT